MLLFISDCNNLCFQLAAFRIAICMVYHVYIEWKPTLMKRV